MTLCFIHFCPIHSTKKKKMKKKNHYPQETKYAFVVYLSSNQAETCLSFVLRNRSLPFLDFIYENDVCLMVVGRLIVCSLIKGLQLFRPHLAGLGFFLRVHSFTVTRLLSLPPSFHEAYHIVSRVWDSLFSLLLTLDVDVDVDVAIDLVLEWTGIGIRAQMHPKTNKKKRHPRVHILLAPPFFAFSLLLSLHFSLCAASHAFHCFSC